MEQQYLFVDVSGGNIPTVLGETAMWAKLQEWRDNDREAYVYHLDQVFHLTKCS